ncbi:hypothetical protein PLESTB_001796800 [Pleodorina starrii]|uniref:F5/8 type C domain-containing protein n=1 Tax=Pleodorina starrii TaxID=330485 RepID=A0A9W6C1F7_9CHLO|nr:hypothetical protein PLESTB_001796800 [Pleodorina starrii]
MAATYAIFHAGDTDTRPWLSIDLGAVYNISSIVIYNRLDCCGDRLEGAEVRVGNVSIKSTADTGKIPQNPLVWKQDSPIDTGGIYTIIIPSSSPAIGRWVTLQNFNSKGEQLNLQEVAVYGLLIPQQDLALDKPAYSSSQLYDKYGPENAVDGDSTTVIKPDGSYAIFHSADNDTKPWLSIDLGSPFNISKVVLHNRLDCCGERLKNAEVRVGNTSITTTADTNKISQNKLIWKLDGSGETGEVYTIVPNSTVIGRWVTLQNFSPTGKFQIRITL